MYFRNPEKIFVPSTRSKCFAPIRSRVRIFSPYNARNTARTIYKCDSFFSNRSPSHTRHLLRYVSFITVRHDIFDRTRKHAQCEPSNMLPSIFFQLGGKKTTRRRKNNYLFNHSLFQKTGKKTKNITSQTKVGIPVNYNSNIMSQFTEILLVFHNE